MTIVAQTADKLILEDIVRKMGARSLIIALSMSGTILLWAFYSEGLIPGTGPHQYVKFAGRLSWAPFTIYCVLAALLALGTVAQEYTQVVLDKVTGNLSVYKVGRFDRRLARRERLERVRRAFIDEAGDTWRLNFEMADGSMLVPRRTYDNCYGPLTLSQVTDEVNLFLSSPRRERAARPLFIVGKAESDQRN
ncbi:MAG TPA: hypothetical protein VE621_02615 [Bryobacteraceae bacterium]|jgi:hypothetical protein|nr:hypothetical protein [Bryobacteraceae bacterium]